MATAAPDLRHSHARVRGSREPALAELLRQVLIAIRRARSTHLRRFRMGHQDFLVLTSLHRATTMPVSSLTLSLRLSKPALSRTLSTLLRSGLVVAARGATDRRTLSLSLTPAGESRARQLVSFERHLEAGLTRRVSTESLDGLCETLREILANGESLADG